MKWLAIALLLLNVLLFSWQFNQYIRAQTIAAAGLEELPNGAPSLRLLSELAELPAERSIPIAQDASETQTSVAVDADAPIVQAVDLSTEINSIGNASNVCVDVGPITDDERVLNLRTWLRDHTTVVHTRSETVRERRFFWVYLEPASDEEARQKLSDLARAGVTDYMLIRRGGLKNAISLGLFRSQDSVNRRLAEMTRQGYKPVVVPKFETTENYFVRATLAQGAEETPIPAELTEGTNVETGACTPTEALATPDS